MVTQVHGSTYLSKMWSCVIEVIWTTVQQTEGKIITFMSDLELQWFIILINIHYSTASKCPFTTRYLKIHRLAVQELQHAIRYNEWGSAATVKSSPWVFCNLLNKARVTSRTYILLNIMKKQYIKNKTILHCWSHFHNTVNKQTTNISVFVKNTHICIAPEQSKRSVGERHSLHYGSHYMQADASEIPSVFFAQICRGQVRSPYECITKAGQWVLDR